MIVDSQECPLWVISEHFAVQSPCPLYPRKRTFAVQKEMSALGQKRTSEKAVLGIPDDYAARSTRTLISLRSALKSMGLAKSAKISASNEALDRNNPTTPTRPSCNLPA